ncbi:transcriptional activator protein UGA3 [Microdochium nivale]|nr:transcriptional activator protein UGA3 [Microdochium nivale]
MKSSRKFPVIAPKPASGQASHDGGDATVLPARPRLPPQRLQRASGSSCVACRRHKIRCDGRLPSCSPCAKRGRTCEYQASRKGDVRELEQSGRVVRLLRTLPYDQALALLSSLRNSNRSGSNQDDAAGERLLLSRPLRAPPATATEPGLAFELLVRFPAAYPALFPLAVSDLHEAELLRPSPPFLRNADTPAGSDWPSPSSLSSPSASTQASTMASHLVPNLSLLDITRWTTVEIPSAIAIQVIALYLANDHPILPLFDQALFLRSLLGYQNYHCSTLLVNALLAWSCQSISAVNPQALIFGPALLREADRLWAARAAHHNTLTSVTALQLMSMAAAAHGDEDASRRYATAGCALGRLMGLFDVSSAQHSAAAWASRHEDWLRAASSTAWGTFNWTCVRALHYQHLDILTPPLLPMPGLTGNSVAGHDDVDGNDGDAADGEQSASSRRLDGSSVRASCQLFVIFHDVAKQYLGTGGPDDARRADGSRKHCPLDIGSVEIYYKKLLDWASGLPLGLVRGDHNNHQVTMLQ